MTVKEVDNMSEIVSAYTLSSDVLSKAGKFVSERQYDQFWNVLATEADIVVPGYGYSGAVLAIVIECLFEGGIELPVDLTTLSESAMSELNKMGLVVCARQSDAAKVIDSLERFSRSEDQLYEFYREYTNESSPEIAEAMRAGIDFLLEALRRVQKQGDWLILLIG
jgi:hypothetical protein